MIAEPATTLAAATGGLGVSLAAWLLTPLLLYVAGLGVGLLAERLSGARLPDPLLVPVGVCGVVVLAMPGYRIGAGVWLALVVVGAAVAAGLVLGRRELRSRAFPGKAAAVAGAVVFALYLGPVIAAGGWTWTGYNFVNDTAVQFLLADHLADTGSTKPVGPPDAPPVSTATEHVRSYLDTAYPLGLHALLATTATALPAPIEAVYQPLIAVLAALGAMALAGLARHVVRGGWGWAALIGALPMSANLTYNYGLQGNAKEIGMVSAVVIAAAVGREALTAPRPARAVALVAVPLAAALAFFSAAALPYVAAFAAVMLAAAFVQEGSTVRRDLVRCVAVGAGTLAVLSAATLSTIARFGEVAQGTFSATSPAADLGHLLRPLPIGQAGGVWLVGDYRVAVPGVRGVVTTLLIVAVVALAVGALVWCLRRRETGLGILLLTVALALAVFEPRLSPYAAAKMIMILGPGLLLGAAVGVVAVGRRWRPVGYALAALLVGGVAVSNAYAYRSVRVAPVDRMEALRDVGDRYAGKGLLLVDDMEEFAKYFMGDAHMNVALELVTPAPVRDKLARSFQPRHADLDQMALEYVEQFPYIVQRRGPDASRPPANFVRDYENRLYTVWRRVGEQDAIAGRVPLQDAYAATAAAPCDQLTALADAVGPGEALLAATIGEQVRVDVLARRPRAWEPDTRVPRSVVPSSPGTVSDTQPFRGGRYRVWVAGSLGRDVEVRVDGRTVGTAGGVNTEGEWLDAGATTIAAGTHRIEIVRPGGSLRPGDAFVGELGPVVFASTSDAGRVVRVKPSRVGDLCDQQLDWVEVVRRDRVPASLLPEATR